MSEPPQPKIKIKVAPGQEIPPPPKKITIHVANTRGTSAESPAPQTAASVSSDGAPNGTLAKLQFGGQHSTPPVNLAQLDKARSLSVAASPSPSAAGMKREEAARPSPAVFPRPITAVTAVSIPAIPTMPAVPPVPAAFSPAIGVPVPIYNGNHYPSAPLQNGHHPAAATTGAAIGYKYRLPGRGKFIHIWRSSTVR